MAVSRPWPLVGFTQHPLRWALNHLHLLLAAVVLAYIGMLIVAGMYYLVFEVNPTMTRLWHHLVTDNSLRHAIRDVGEGVLGGLLAQQVVWNHYRKRRAPNWLDRTEMRFHIPSVKDERPLSFWQVIATPPLVVIYAIPGFLVAFWLVGSIHHTVTTAIALEPTAVHTSPILTVLWSKLQAAFMADWDKKLIGYSAAFFFGRRPAKGVFDDLQTLLVERRIAGGKPLRWYYPPTYKARYNDLLKRGGIALAQQHQHRLVSALVLLSVVLGLVLAAFGGYVLVFIA